jgi:hypothetical protein
MSTKQELIDGFLKDPAAQPYLNQFEATGKIDMTNPEAVRAIQDHNNALWELICAANADEEKLVIKLMTQFLMTTENLSLKWAQKLVELALAHPDRGDPSWSTTLITRGIITLEGWTRLTHAAAQEALSTLSVDKLEEFCWNDPAPTHQDN